MKKIIGIILLTGSMYQSFGQNNTFPVPSGNTGIGTTTPATKLEVVVAPTTTQTNGIRLRSNGTLYADFLSTGPTYNAGGVGANEIWLNSQAGHLVLGPATAHDLKFVANGAERMRLLSNGNLGIGTSGNTGGRLSIAGGSLPSGANAGALNFSGSLAAGRLSAGDAQSITGVMNTFLDASNIEISSGTSSGQVSGMTVSGLSSVATAAAGTVRFWTSSSERMRINSAGNVGIGTTNPTAKVSLGNYVTTVAGNVGALAIYESGNSKYGVSVNNQGFLDICGNQTNAGGIRFFNGTDNIAPTERMRISPTGNVGIGTTTPSTKLSFGNYLTSTAGTVGTVALYETGNTKYGVSVHTLGFLDISGNQASAGGIRFFNGTDNTAPTERMRITPSGNVGIGTVNPQAKLTVNGDIYAKKVKVTTSGWSDFVFEESYILKPLSEVEAFILANKHLPEVPSAEEVAKNDLDLGEMNKVLLQKVEELTLYLIALEKENKLQKERVDNLEKLVNAK